MQTIFDIINDKKGLQLVSTQRIDAKMCQTMGSSLIYTLIITLGLFDISVAMCPRFCVCDDIRLRTTCGSESQLDYVPHTLNPVLKELVLLDTHIRGIKSSLSVYQNLEVLDISRNQLLTDLGEFNFEDNKRIETMILRTNHLTTILNNTFNGLMSLKKLYLSDNKISELNANAFKPLSSLQLLDLSSNQITYISLDAFRGLQNLNELNLRTNRLNTIPTNCLQFVPKLHVLDLGSNSVFNLSNDAFSHLTYLSELCLDGCAISAVQTNAFKGLSQLSILRFQNNNLEEMPSKAFSELTNLEELQIGENYFTSLQTKGFSNLKNLRILEINKTQSLSSIQLGAFEQLSHLERLEMSDNKLLTHIDGNVFNDVPNLRYLILQSNGFKTLRLDFINAMERPIFLDVRDNPFHCNCSLEWLRNYLLQTNTSAKQLVNTSNEDISYPFSDLLISVSRVECLSPPALSTKLIIELNRDEFGCFELDTKVPIIIAILIGILVICGVIAMFVIRCKYGLSGLVKNQWFSGDNNTSNSDSLRNDLNYRKPEFVFIPNIDLNIDESNRGLEETVRYPLKMTPITEL